MFRFRLYGLAVASDRTIEGIAESPGRNGAEVRVRFSAQRGRRRPDDALELFASLGEGDAEYLRVLRSADGGFVFRFDNGARFEVSAGGARINASWPESITFQDVTSYLLGPVLGFVVRLRGTVCLHASAVLVDGAAVAFLGGGGSGKSSLCAYFAGRGHAVLTDDVLALRLGRRGFRVLPGPARIRLWPDTARQLYGADTVLARVLPSDPGWDKRYRDFPSGTRTAPLAAIYMGDVGAPQRPRIAPCAGREAFLQLAVNRYPVRLPVPGQSGREFSVLAALAKRVPVRRIEARRNLRGLGALHDAVRKDLRRLAERALRAGTEHVRIAG
jgi:hypothetical protein